MIPVIGVMIGCYIFTRMLHLNSDPEIGHVTAFFTIVTMIVSFLGVTTLLFLH